MSKIYELNFLEYILIVIPLIIAIAFAMIRINDTPLIKFIFLFLEFSIKPKGRIWDHRGISASVAPDLGESSAETDTTSIDSELDLKAKRAANLRQLTVALDSGAFDHLRDVEHDDLDVTHDDDLVTQAYFGNKKGESDTENMYWRTTEAHKKMLDAFAAMPVTKLKKGSVEAMEARQEIEKVKKEVEAGKASKTAQPNAQQTDKTSVSNQATHARKPNTVQPQQSATTKKPRKRQRPVAQPIRSGIVDTTDKSKPSKIVSGKQKADKSATETPKSKKDGEFEFRELEKDIDINLD